MQRYDYFSVTQLSVKKIFKSFRQGTVTEELRFLIDLKEPNNRCKKQHILHNNVFTFNYTPN